MHNIYAFSIYVLDIDTAFVIEKNKKLTGLAHILNFLMLSK